MFIVYIIRPFDEKRNILKVRDDDLTCTSEIVKMYFTTDYNGNKKILVKHIIITNTHSLGIDYVE